MLERIEREELGDGGHQAVRIALIMVGGMIVLRCPNVGHRTFGHRLIILAVSRLDVEQREELFVRSEGLAAFQNWTVGSAERLEYDDEEEKSKGKKEAPSILPQRTPSKPP